MMWTGKKWTCPICSRWLLITTCNNRLEVGKITSQAMDHMATHRLLTGVELRDWVHVVIARPLPIDGRVEFDKVQWDLARAVTGQLIEADG
jgi:hypothetical protein